MALVNQTLKLEITPGGVPPKLHVTEYDESMQVTAQLFQRGQYYEIPSGTAAKVEGTLAGHPFSVDATVDGSNVTFELTKGMTAYAGRAWTKIKLTKDGKPVSTCGFWLECDRAGVEAGTIASEGGFEEQLYGMVVQYLNYHGGGVLPPNGIAGQVLVSDGSGGALWATVETGGSSSTPVIFDDRNDSVKAYLAAANSYTAANRGSVSVIGSYASTAIQDQDCPKPYLDTYNLLPGVDNIVSGWAVRRANYAPRMLKLSGVWNVRDCGGWSADGGTVKFGKLFRGARLDGATSDDLATLAAAGIKLELDIRDAANAAGTVATIPGSTYQNVPINNAYASMINSEATAAANACIAAMQSIAAGNPVYVHCASGADRTGCICAMLLALLGVSDPDIDRDFEMTGFADVENLTGHTRSGSSWTGFWSALNGGQANAKMNVAAFLRSHGATTAMLNAFRQAAIDGTPSDIDMPTYSVTSNLTGCTNSNSAASVVSGSSYAATITPQSGYAMSALTVTMGGTDITATAYNSSTGMISIASVTGTIVITALAEAIVSYTNLVRQSVERTSTAVYNGGLGYKNGYYISGSNESANASDCMTGCIPYTISADTQPTDILYIKGYTGTAGASHTRLKAWASDKSTSKGEYNGFLSSNNIFDVEVLNASSGYYKLTPKTGIHHRINNVAFLQFSFNQADGSGIIITKNETID